MPVAACSTHSLLSTRSNCDDCGLSRRCLGEFDSRGHALPLARLIETHAPLDALQTLYHQGDRMRSVYLVQSGSLKSIAEFADGSRQVLAFHEPGSWVGFDGVGDGRHNCRVEALERCRVCVLPWAAAQDLALRDPEVQRRLFSAIGGDALAAQRHLEMMACPAPRRLARFLLDRSRLRQQGSREPLVLDLPMSREDIASYLGVAEETICRQFTRLQEEGALAVERRIVHIRDMTLLAQIGAGERSTPPAPAARITTTVKSLTALH